MSEIEKVKQALLFRLDNLEGNSANEKFIKIINEISQLEKKYPKFLDLNLEKGLLNSLEKLYEPEDHVSMQNLIMYVLPKIGSNDNLYKKIKEICSNFRHPHLDFDSITIAPYMGKDSVEPFLEYKGKYAILLILTSNEGASDFQLLSAEGKPLYERVIEQSKNGKMQIG